MANPHRLELVAEILHKLLPQQMQFYAHGRQLVSGNIAWLICSLINQLWIVYHGGKIQNKEWVI